ncbi:acetylornithine deacetylase [Phaeobacter sp.]|uniref:acetylornithine deacetylase n=1 Tax=Phaeobacter sp. TaxID=1902409 RepID=UPI0025D36317|nr:acetylornithine deacetylase [Phaeobacter sp.]
MRELQDITEILARLVGFRTLTDGPNLDLINWVEAFLTNAGFEVTRITAPCGDKAGLLAKFGTGDGGVLYSAHSDVVPVAGQSWSADPFVLRPSGTRLIGRGTTDMKGFLACVLAEAQTLRSNAPAKPFMIALSWDEEIGCRGIPQMIDHVLPCLGRPDLAIIGEPTEMRLCLGHKGKASYRAICQGEAGHSALAPNFQNALHPAAEVILSLRDLQTQLAQNGARDDGYTIPYATAHVGMMSGGVALNIVPEHAEIAFEIRHLSDEDPDALLAGTISTLPAGVSITQTGAYPGLNADPHHPAIRALLPFLTDASPIKVAFGTEAGFFAGLGLPSVVIGPGSMAKDGHKADEGIELAQLEACRIFIGNTRTL